MNCSIETFQIEIPIGLLEIDYCLNGLHKTELKRIDLKSNPLKIHLINPKQIESKTTKLRCILLSQTNLYHFI